VYFKKKKIFKMKSKEINSKNYNNLLDRIANILVEARTKAVREINKAQGLAY
jgi:Tfp pilus assembly protein FimT